MDENPKIKIIHRIEYIAFVLVGTFFRMMPRNVSYFFAGLLGNLSSFVLPKRKKIANENLKFAFPDMSDTERKHTVKRCFENMAKATVDLFWLSVYNKENFFDHFEIDHPERLQVAHEKGSILMTAHLGFWEAGAVVFPALGIPCRYVSKTIKNPLINQKIQDLRCQHGNECIDKKNALKMIMRTLKENKSVGILIDQHAHKEEAVLVPFFKKPAYTSHLVIQMAIKKEVPFIPVFCYRGRGKFQIVVGEPIFFPNDTSQENIIACTTKINEILENVISKKPEQWMWIHRRWRD